MPREHAVYLGIGLGCGVVVGLSLALYLGRAELDRQRRVLSAWDASHEEAPA
jgi:hypothetical protein